MKRCVLFIVSAILFLCIMNNEVIVPLANVQNIVFIGDSVTSGYGLDFPKAQSFVYDIANDGYSISKFSVPGLTSNNLSKIITNTVNSSDDGYDIESQINGKSLKNAVNSANYVSITTGGADIISSELKILYDMCNSLDITLNDLITKLLEEKLDSYEILSLGNYFKKTSCNDLIQNVIRNFNTNLNTVVQTINTENPNAKIIIQTIYNPYLGLPQSGLSRMLVELVNTFIMPMNAYIASIASNNKSVIVADVANAFIANSNTSLTNATDANISSINKTRKIDVEIFLKDVLDPHPNEVGNSLIANVLRSVLQPK